MSYNNVELNELNVVQMLEQAGNPQHAGSEIQKLAEQQLKAWEIKPGFHHLLQSVYLDLSNPLQVRWLAVIQFKNGIDKYWRSTRVHAISKEEKSLIRSRLFELIDEQNNQLTIQNAQAASKISRLDFPGEWPNLFEQLEHLLKDNHIRKNPIEIHNILIHINQIIKILGTARIGRCKPAMQSKVPLIFPLIVRIYLESFDEWTNSVLSHNNSEINYSDNLIKLQVAYLALKVLRRIVCEGYEKPHKDESVCEFLKLTIGHFDLLVANQATLGKYDIYERFIKCYGKLYYNLVAESPATFILLPCSIRILISYTKLLFEKASEVYSESTEVTGDFWENTTIRALLLLKRVITFTNKKGNVITLKARSDKQSIQASINRINVEFLNENLVKKLVDVLMESYLKLRPSELENWFLDPEEWINEQMATSYEYQIRPCAENFFQDLINSFSELLVPYLLNKIETDAASLSSSLDDFLKKDAIYASFQLSAAAVSDMVDFDKLLVEVFLPDARNSNKSEDELKIIRRRVALVINEWSTIKCSEESKRLCYKFFCDILMTEEDKVVLLTVLQSLRTMIDDWNFNKETFQPFLNDIVVVLLRKILPSVSLTETRLYVLNTISDIIIQTRPLINKDILIEILRIVPDLWDVATNNASESILSNSLLRLLRNLVTSLGSYSYLTWEIAIPVLSFSCNPSSAQYALLNEDGFELWSALLQNFTEKEHGFDDKFIEILPYLEHGIDTRTEILPTLLEIIKSYAMILPQNEFFSIETFAKVFSNLAAYLLKLREDSFQLILEIWEVLALRNEEDQENRLLTQFYQTGVLNSLFNCVFQEESLSSYQCGQIVQVIARISYVNPNALIEFLSNFYQSLPSSYENLQLPLAERKIVNKDMPFEEIIQKLIAVWIVCYKDLYDPKLKKIHLLGLSSLLRTNTISILFDFEGIVSLWVDMLEEINETNGGDCERYHLNDIVTDQSLAFYPLTNEQLRQHDLCKDNDPVHNISLKEFINQTLNFLKENLGPERYNELLQTVNPTLLENLRLFLSIQPNGI
ncbi:hypothetical protein KAFR_0H02700 [Kazachstania africana CBS 2517]|uniref:Importin N-terminal domain-containing protein n=1 Tax=Kazachstania africana (strain ATCC 22294 / BCRC 22015 / CBS 2517 / CECT 1963 / NBRC 1671 / NRRL Y-8276) TaxID=1071382 RepID=H2AZC3_KAZAF|nr:hypothetical protein KAFR_0H02700 [Kazachstania africana CBS 2517]CCF59679.1 hypothetical protein KAFR_0H02700 [Kazachstania africana CBS 2517]